MKIKLISRLRLSSFLAGIALAGSGILGQAQTAVNPNSFDASAGSWIIWNDWGMQGWTLGLDPNGLDAAGDPASSSLRYEVPFTGASGEQFMTFGTLANRWGWDGGVVMNCVGSYTNLSFDIKMDPNAPTVNNNYGPLEVGLVTDGWGTQGQGTYNIPLAATEWTHVNIPIDQTTPNLDKVTGVFIKMWSNGAYTNTMTFNIDNLWIEPVPTNAPPTPPPSMSLEKTITGLNLIAAGSGQYDRQNIRTVSPGYSWVNKGSSPVSYSFTVKSYPGTNNPNFEVHNYLIPVPYDLFTGVGTIDTQSSPDWNQINCIFMELQNKADGSAAYTFRWKTNSIPDGNGTYYSSPLAVLTETNGPLGTWTLSFVNNTQATMTGPSGSSTNFEFSIDKLAGYVDINNDPLPLYFYLGVKPQETTNRGLSAVISRVQLQGFASNIDDNFTSDAALNTNLWETAANNAGSIQLLNSDALYWIGWTLPDAGFAFQTNSTYSVNGWNENNTTPLLSGLGKKVLISRADLPSSGQGYFRLIKRPFTKLQVLLPGETNAPGTATGKTGTPTAQNVSVPFDVTVYAVDDTWHRISLAPNDAIAITCTDEYATLPAEANLAAGARTFSVTMGAEGTFTVTASDSTDATKKADVSSSVTINP